MTAPVAQPLPLPPPPPLLPVDDFMLTNDFRRLLVEFVQIDMLTKMRLLCKDWRRVVDAFIDRKVESGEMTVIGGNEISYKEAEALKERRSLITQVVFLLNMTKVEAKACIFAVNLIVVEIPEGVESIGNAAFKNCHSLTTVSFPKSLTYIGDGAFVDCSSLETVDLLHTNLQELGRSAFLNCFELRSMTIPDSLQTLGRNVFAKCGKLVPSHIDIYHKNANLKTIAHLRSLQSAK
ncbi:hypothetical protein TrVE_jg7821 [Triparma verrucosa]|uniref:Uncharacterized protein n=1 Tax=Triparma verrucosa TaxID=1606542 RepID=A0A9W7F132_9STRA|nr:hypothetical protein TrVE_jg7821 [Triparma verrucosa]